MKFFKTIPKLPKHKEPTFSHQHTCAYVYTVYMYMYIANTHVNTEPQITCRAHTPHLPTCTCCKIQKLNIFTLYAHTCTYMYMYVHTCTCTHYVHVHVHCTLYIVHCTRTFFTFIPILNQHQNYHQNLKN